MYYKTFIVTVEGIFSPFCPQPAPLGGYYNIDEAVQAAIDITNELRKKDWSKQKKAAVTVYNTEKSIYEAVFNLNDK